MYTFYPYFTNDGSVGLYSPEADDIYHSTYGALSEALEKFVLPMELSEFIKRNNQIKILDICYGIGYNSKTFLDFFIKNFLLKNNTTAAIGSDNISLKNTNKKSSNFNIYIKAIDTDKTLAYLSPFIVTGKKYFRSNKLSFHDERVEKFLNKKNVISKENSTREKIKYLFSNRKKKSVINNGKFLRSSNPKISPVTNIIFLLEIINSHPEFLTDVNINHILTDKKYKEFLARDIAALFNFKRNQGYKYTLLRRLNVFLHNIYYNHLSISYKKALKCLKLCNFNFDLKICDARNAIIEDKNTYNFVFLDAFTPAKCPALWTLDFFKLLYDRIDEDGIILTYSNSASVRKAFLESGFYVGKIYNESESKFIGTIASKNKSLIKNELSQYDLGLLNTKAGIVYRDKNLNASNEAIIASHKSEVETSDLESSSSYIKKSGRKHNV